MKERIKQITTCLKEQIFHSLQHLYDIPELSGEEIESSAFLADLLKNYRFEITQPYCNKPTAFHAIKKGKQNRPSIAFLAEYDALPDIGHGCGHNFIGTASTFAGIVLGELIKDINGSVCVIGTPEEETIGGKIELLERGGFEEIDASLMVHPSSESHGGYRSLACIVIEIAFTGKTAHAAAAPWKGINALDALIQTFVSIDALKKQLRPTVRIPGIIKEGGKRANMVPDRAVGHFSIRAETVEELREVMDKVVKCAEAASMATGAKLSWQPIEKMYYDFKINSPLMALFEKNWQEFGGIVVRNPNKSTGSVDIGNLSRFIPCLHGYVQICDFDIAGHTREFAQATLTDRGKQQLLRSIETLAYTAYQLLSDPQLLTECKSHIEVKI